MNLFAVAKIGFAVSRFFSYTLRSYINRYLKRHVSLAVIVDDDLVANPLWQERKLLIEKTLALVNNMFEREFNIRFSVASTPTFSYIRVSLPIPCIWVDGCLADFSRQRTMFDADIFFVVTDKILIRLYNQNGQTINKTEKIASSKQIAGIGLNSGIAIVQLLLPDELTDDPNTNIWCHEIGHMFGAEHTGNPQSIMYPTAEFMIIPTQFDSKNKKIILRNKFKKFSKEFSLQ